MEIETEKDRYFCFEKTCLKAISYNDLKKSHQLHYFHSLYDQRLNIDFFRDDLHLDDFHKIFSEIALRDKLK